MNLNLLTAIFSLLALFTCGQPATKKLSDEELLIAKERAAFEQRPKLDGKLSKTITFDVTAPIEDYSDGVQPWIRIDSPEVNIPNLINKDEIVVLRNKVKVIIDYPLREASEFEIRSEDGFSREDLIIAISHLYHQIYNDEERTATIKTLPLEQRVIYNRNETNGKYGIWGHDIGDLVLTEIDVFISPQRQIILTLNIDS
ncbi:hypothetical protein M1D52_07245 [Olivibacter sp. SA151]|uniref:hypothetical protein n=1 Tax=Olivibacter jilunii TaxID=985016 RepID=UPI003F18FEA2